MALDLKKLNHVQLNDLIARAHSRKQELRQERLVKARDKLIALAKAEGFTIEELFGMNKSRKTRRPAGAKYRNPADHTQLWSGRGKRPHWFSAAVAAGKKERELLIQS